MKKPVLYLLISFIFAGYASSMHGQKLTDKLKIKLENQVDTIFHYMIKTAENMEYDKLSQGVDDHLNAGFIINGFYYSHYDTLIQEMKTKSLGISKQRITIQKEKVTALSETIVLLTAAGNSAIETNDGRLFDVKFSWSFVYEKINNQWKVIHSHQSGNR